jgi:hypothetical protein
VRFEVIERRLLIVADLDQLAVRIAHLTAPFPPAIIERFADELSALRAPFFVPFPNVGHTQVQETTSGVEIPRRFENYFRLIRRRPASGI